MGSLTQQVKHQVFISSTYVDLINERKKILDVLLMADCIPAGMEAFVATDNEQFNVIKKVIDLCDYYLLIIGKRYGSVNKTTGLSYTEMEYDYACSSGIPVLVFAIDDNANVDNVKVDSDLISIEKLKLFKQRAMTNRLASIWRDTSDLMGQVAIAIMRAKQEIYRPGWHRGARQDQESVLMELLKLKNENDELKLQIEDLKAGQNITIMSEDWLDNEILLHCTETVYVFTHNTIVGKKVVSVTLKELFKFISLRLTGITYASKFQDVVSSYVSGYYVEPQDALIVRNKLEQLKLLESFIGKDNAEMLQLTEFGKQTMNKLNTV